MAKGTVVDFTGVEGGGRTRVPEDDYRLKCVQIKPDTSKAGNSMWVWKWEIVGGKFAGKTLIDRTTFTKESLWKLKQILEAFGITVPNKRVALNPQKYIGKELGATVVDDEYENRISSKIADYVSLDVLEADEDEEMDDDTEEDEDQEEEPTPKKGKKGKKGKKSKPVSDEEEEIEDLDLDEL